MMSNNKTARNFTASLKPALTMEQLQQLGNRLDGIATLWAIKHDKDYNEDNGEYVEPHTHLLIFYNSPSRISTVANLLGVAPNFIEVVNNKTAMLKYLTHINDPNKYQYDYNEVYTNGRIDYQTAVLNDALTNKEIIEMLKSDSATELVNVVPIHKLRALQAILFYDQNDNNLKEQRKQYAQLERQTQLLNEISERNLQMVQQLTSLTNDFAVFREHIAQELSRLPEATKQFATGLLGGLDNLTLQLKNVALVGVGQKPDFL